MQQNGYFILTFIKGKKEFEFYFEKHTKKQITML